MTQSCHCLSAIVSPRLQSSLAFLYSAGHTSAVTHQHPSTLISIIQKNKTIFRRPTAKAPAKMRLCTIALSESYSKYLTLYPILGLYSLLSRHISAVSKKISSLSLLNSRNKHSPLPRIERAKSSRFEDSSKYPINTSFSCWE